MSKTPPKYPLQLFRWFCNPEYVDDIEGDLLERFEKRPSKWWLAIEVLKLFRPEIIRNLGGSIKLNYYGMFKHNIKVSLRNFTRHKTSFFINYIGLVGGLVTVLFIYLWVNHELSVDRFHKNDNQLYRLVSGNGNTNTILNTNAFFAWEIEESIPEIDYVVNSCWGPLYSWLAVEENSFSTRGEFGSKHFFELFSYPLLSGNSLSVLEQPNAIVLSETMAMKLFKSIDIVGKQLVWRWYSHEEPVIVSGVFRDLPKNSSEQFDYVLNFKVYEKLFGNRLKRQRNARTYVSLAEGASAEVVNQKIHDYTRATYPEYEGAPYFIIDYADYYLKSQYENGKLVGGRIELVRLFIVIGLLILVVACINFMNLSTARAALRTKEIGVRKTMGALRKSLVYQYLTESCLISLFAGLTAVGIFFLLLPFFESLLEQQIQISFNPSSILVFVGIIFFTGLISGSYPALYLSGFSPLKVLKGPFVASVKNQWFRKGLVVFQFGISLILIVSVIVIYQQMQFIQTKNLGYQDKYIINFRTTGMGGSKQEAFLDEVRKAPGVINAAGISHALFGAQKSGANITWNGKDPENEIWFEWDFVGYDMLELLEIGLKEGRFFSKNFGDEQSKVVINKKTQELMGVPDPIGEKLMVGEKSYEIIGVTEDFHFQSLHEQIKPTFFLLNNDWAMKLAIRIEPGRMAETLNHVEGLYDKFNPGFPFEYSFHKQDQAEMYDSETKVSMLTKYASGLAILISSLGLLGLVSFVTEQKAKEMSIRKVLGASSKSLISVLSKDFALPIMLSTGIGLIMALVIMDYWLDGFAYRIQLEWWFFAIAIAIMFLLIAITSSNRIIKAINSNPVDFLKDE